MSAPRPAILFDTNSLIDALAYDADYYLHGRETGKSLYEDYRWLPELTIPMCEAIVKHLGIEPQDVVLDYGCARGYCVKAFWRLGILAWGMDISEWAIANADEEVRGYVEQGHSLAGKRADWVIAKDVLEHLTDEQLQQWLAEIPGCAKKGAFVVVPLSEVTGGPYVVPEYEQDVTHVQRRTLYDWMALFEKALPDWILFADFRIAGVKDNWSHYPRGNGFLTLHRLPEPGIVQNDRHLLAMQKKDARRNGK